MSAFIRIEWQLFIVFKFLLYMMGDGGLPELDVLPYFVVFHKFKQIHLPLFLSLGSRVEIESRSEEHALQSNIGISQTLQLIKDSFNQIAHLYQRLLAGKLEALIRSVFVQQVHEHYLALSIPSIVPELFLIIFPQLLSIPSL